MYVHRIMMVAFLSLLHVVNGKSKLEIPKFLGSVVGGVLDVLQSGIIQSHAGKKQECVQCVDARVEQEHLRDHEDLYRTPNCSDAETADAKQKITLQSCVDVPNDAYVSKCGYLDGNIQLTIGNDEPLLHLQVRGCFKFDQGTKEGCSSDKDVINKQILKLGIRARIIGFGRDVDLENPIKIADINGRLCNNVDAAVNASRNWWIMWYLVLANYLLR